MSAFEKWFYRKFWFDYTECNQPPWDQKWYSPHDLKLAYQAGTRHGKKEARNES